MIEELEEKDRLKETLVSSGEPVRNVCLQLYQSKTDFVFEQLLRSNLSLLLALDPLLLAISCTIFVGF